MTLAGLNAAPPDLAARELERCCGSRIWVNEMVECRPFTDEAQLFTDAARIWVALTNEDWLEAFSRHPRIGGRAAGWESDEQSGVRDAATGTRRALAERNQEYERRFGYVFLICATRKTADEMLAELEQRMDNDPALELRVAAAEQMKITRLRLEKLLHPHLSGTS